MALFDNTGGIIEGVTLPPLFPPIPRRKPDPPGAPPIPGRKPDPPADPLTTNDIGAPAAGVPSFTLLQAIAGLALAVGLAWILRTKE